MESSEAISRDTISFAFLPCIGTLWVGLTLRLGLGLGAWNESPFELDVIVMQ